MAAALAAMAVSVATLAMNGPAQGLNLKQIGAPDPNVANFPSHYTDDFGTSLQLCVDRSVQCGRATPQSDGAGGPGVAVPGDGEGFYWMATATVRTPRGSIDVEFAHEAAWASTTRRIVFDRTRIRGNLARGKYTLLTPYGRTPFTAVGTGARTVNLTQDPPCTQTAAGTRCSTKMDNWLYSTSAPVGYLGNGVRLSTVKGGTLRNDLVLLDSKGKVIGRTAKFAITGKLAGPAALLSTDMVSFSNTPRVVHRTIRLKNQGASTDTLNLQGISLVGAKTLTLSPKGCPAVASLASGASCPITITYRPGLRRPSSARLVINDNTFAGVHRVPVKTGTPR